jgi:hypothetical protein
LQVLAQDDGVELAAVRGFEIIPELVPQVPEVAYMPILRRAYQTEVNRMLKNKPVEEAQVLLLAREVLDQHQVLVGLHVM